MKNMILSNSFFLVCLLIFISGWSKAQESQSVNMECNNDCAPDCVLNDCEEYSEVELEALVDLIESSEEWMHDLNLEYIEDAYCSQEALGLRLVRLGWRPASIDYPDYGAVFIIDGENIEYYFGPQYWPGSGSECVTVLGSRVFLESRNYNFGDYYFTEIFKNNITYKSKPGKQGLNRFSFDFGDYILIYDYCILGENCEWSDVLKYRPEYELYLDEYDRIDVFDAADFFENLPIIYSSSEKEVDCLDLAEEILTLDRDLVSDEFLELLKYLNQMSISGVVSRIISDRDISSSICKRSM